MAQTAVEMLAESLRLSHKEAYNDLFEVIEQAKQMEFEQKREEYQRGYDDGIENAPEW